MKIPMVDLTQQYHRLKDQIDAGMREAMETGAFILGPNVQAFEKEAADYLGVKHAIGVGSGTDALHLALLALGIKPGDEVITTPFTFIATAEAIKYVGATPVFVDINPNTFNLDLDAVARAITDKTRAVIPVHLFGQPVDMASLKALCDAHKLHIVEDCAQSFGAHIQGQQTGSFGNLGAFSFFPSKNLGCYGDGGLVSTNCDDLAALVRQYRNHGSKVQYHHSLVGYTSRLDELQAVVLRAKLPLIDEFNDNRRRVDSLYRKHLAGTGIQTPAQDGIGKHVFHQYCCLHPARDKILQALRDAQIACAIYYPVPLHKQEVFAEDCKNVSLPITESIMQQCFALPVYPELSEEKIEHIASVIKAAL
ncbi:DegT/DnrJ/EryC1/StrS family aminotransferase [Simiduia sp. 21SJ11W-1]|uniref:DegT/DnrJ/EryC1/StrS family aminotransferase n=1 Tax=Simiduia sp. 21SJ11W-1 TaxID=2909669 RepID=UPI0020A1C795|nr:DegT/DnrJ/EryC1/StrS family aminotransferase [Simiduia sp. 21SJ11W-1]UTA46733.1 DegT/DnrJ/EryC1/StrS family aminotransferase [Simiduia sp. 21SJ11W-1]